MKLMQKTADERRRLQKKKSRWGDLSRSCFPAVNPDRFLTWVHRQNQLHLQAVVRSDDAAGVSFQRRGFRNSLERSRAGHLEIYNFAHKSWFDLAAFWIIATVLLCIHETGHGLTCKHYGAHVPAMGFLLIYLTPAFYTDTTQARYSETAFERLMIAVSGVWAELMICALVTPIWWGTSPNTAIHDFAYTIILFTGIAVVLINWNPLIKLDGYYIVMRHLGDYGAERSIDALPLGMGETECLGPSRRGALGPGAPSPRVSSFMRFFQDFIATRSCTSSLAFIGNIARNFSADWGFFFE